MEIQKIINLLNDESNDGSRFSTKKWYVIDSQTWKGKYDQNTSIKFETDKIKSSLCDYSDAIILVTGDIIVAANNDTHVAFKNCTLFSTCKTEINVFIDEAKHIYIEMSMYNLIEYSCNYSNTSESLWQSKTDKPPTNNADLNVNNSACNSESFKYKTAYADNNNNSNNTNASVKNAKIVVPFKYLSSFWRVLEMPLINCKIHLELNWTEDCILSSDENSAKLTITDAKFHVPIITLSTKDNVNLTKQLSDGFERSVYWNSYQTIPVKVIKKSIKNKNIYMSYLMHHFKVLKIICSCLCHCCKCCK